MSRILLRFQVVQFIYLGFELSRNPPWDAGLPFVLARPDTNLIATLREFDPSAGDLTAFLTVTSTSGGCDDLAFVPDDFGNWGILVVCGTNGAGAYYYTDPGAVGEWRANPGNPNMGNTLVVDAHVGGDYALIVSFSGRRVFRRRKKLFSPS